MYRKSRIISMGAGAVLAAWASALLRVYADKSAGKRVYGGVPSRSGADLFPQQGAVRRKVTDLFFSPLCVIL